MWLQFEFWFFLLVSFCLHYTWYLRIHTFVFFKGTLFTSKKEISNELWLALQSTGKTTSFIPQQSRPKDQTNINYLLVGVGGAISLFLLILVMQLCKKHKSAGRKAASQRMINENDARDNSTNQAQNWNRKESYQILQGNKSVQCFDRINPEYHEIDECLEKQNPLFNPCSCASENDVSRLPTNSSTCKRSTKHKCSYINNSDDYLQPL